jgi:hypothetical protein
MVLGRLNHGRLNLTRSRHGAAAELSLTSIRSAGASYSARFAQTHLVLHSKRSVGQRKGEGLGR